MPHYDLTDHLILEHVIPHHVPEEDILTSSQGTIIRDLVCAQDKQPWPCDLISDYRQHLAQQRHGGTPMEAAMEPPTWQGDAA